jgi:acetyl-CoA carboxylase carboxyltransferase component
MKGKNMLIKKLFDDEIFTEISSELKNSNVITGFGSVNGRLTYAFMQTGEVTSAHTEKISKLYDLAIKTGNPVVGIFDSSGMDAETPLPLALYQKLIAKSSEVSGVVPQIAVVTGACVGTSALVAKNMDFLVLSDNADFYLKPNSKTETDLADITADSAESAIAKAIELLSFLPSNNLEGQSFVDYDEITGFLFDNVIGFKNYRSFVVGTIDIPEKLTGSDTMKIARFVRFCDAFSIPLVTKINNKSNSCGIKEFSVLASAYAEATTAKINVITGSCIGAVFTALSADFTYAYDTAIISALNPETYVEFAQHDKLVGADNVAKKRTELAEKYVSEKATAKISAELGLVDRIISEENSTDVIVSSLEILSGKRVTKLPKKHNNIVI